MSTQTHAAHVGDRELGDHLAKSAAALLAGATFGGPDATHAVNLAVVKALLAMYWEMRYQRPAQPQVNHWPAARINGWVVNTHEARTWASEPGA